MTNISTMEALEAIPIDHLVTVDGNQWTRTAKGLSRDGVDLALLHFEGRLTHGQVVDVSNAAPEPGQWWSGQTRTYYLFRVTDRRVHYTSFRNGAVYNWAGSSARDAWEQSTSIRRITEPPQVLVDNGMTAVATRMGALTAQAQEAEETSQRLVRENAELQQQVRNTARKPDRVREYVHAIRDNLDAIAQLMEE